MFGSIKKSAASLTDQVDTIIGKETQFKGTISTKGTVRIDGHFEGDVSAGCDVIIGETGKVNAQIKARNALLAGLVNGNLDVSDKLELLPTAKLSGDIKAGVLIVGEGAVYRGACEMKHQGDTHSKEGSTPGKNNK